MKKSNTELVCYVINYKISLIHVSEFTLISLFIKQKFYGLLPCGAEKESDFQGNQI